MQLRTELPLSHTERRFKHSIFLCFFGIFNDKFMIIF